MAERILATWKTGMSSLYHGADPQRCAEEILEIGEEAQAVQIVEKARDETTELHKCFEWDDRKAAENYRIVQAVKLTSNLVIVRTQEARDRLPLRRGYQDCRVYKTTVETPYSIHLDIAMAEPMAWNDGLSRFFGSAWENHDANDLASALNDENSDKNFIYRQEWQTGKNNLWEIVCWHTKPLTM